MKKFATLLLMLALVAPPEVSAYKIFGGGYKEQVEAKDIETSTRDFNGALSSSDKTVQDALDTLDDAAPDLSSYLTTSTAASTYAPIAEPLSIHKTAAKTIVIDGDFYGRFRASPTKKISPPDLGYGYTITNVKVQCASADPTTEFAGDLKWCDAQGTGAFPSTNPTVIKVLDTTTGNYDSGAITESVATGKELYISMDANVDYGVIWTITVTYQLATS
jgi:hypothetical protein